MKRFLFVMLIVGGISVPAWGGDNDIDLKNFIDLTDPQGAFEDLSRDMGYALNLIPLAPAEPLGITGFDIGAELSLIDIDQRIPYWVNSVSDREPPPYLAIPKVHVQKGLPAGIDLGAIYAGTPKSNIQLIGAELKWAFIDGSMVMPALALRGSYTRLLGVDQLNFQTQGVDLSISKGLPFLTPYGGVGGVFVQSETKDLPPPSNLLDLEKVNVALFKGYVGLRISLTFINFTAEVDFAEVNSYNFKLSAGF
ncbi:MAG: hypothetical protein JSU92_15220 [Deltaproteobacteria bacterium]|nr:MAG: hypothetical protein JSU92_15220 [Deltaproteobacteria bacterium]